MNGDEFIDVTKHFSAAKEPARFRSGLSRAYYALYHHVLETWLNAGIKRTFIDGMEHKIFRDFISRTPAYNKIIASDVLTLQDQRINADYKLSSTMDSRLRRECAASVQRYENAKEKFDKLEAKEHQQAFDDYDNILRQYLNTHPYDWRNDIKKIL